MAYPSLVRVVLGLFGHDLSFLAGLGFRSPTRSLAGPFLPLLEREFQRQLQNAGIARVRDLAVCCQPQGRAHG